MRRSRAGDSWRKALYDKGLGYETVRSTVVKINLSTCLFIVSMRGPPLREMIGLLADIVNSLSSHQADTGRHPKTQARKEARGS
jgi:hypothetical protein